MLYYEETHYNSGSEKLFCYRDIHNNIKNCVEFKKENKEWINGNYCKFNLTSWRWIKGVNKYICEDIFIKDKFKYVNLHWM